MILAFPNDSTEKRRWGKKLRQEHGKSLLRNLQKRGYYKLQQLQLIKLQ